MSAGHCPGWWAAASLGLALLTGTAAAEELTAGAAAPDIQALSATGEAVSLQALRGRVVYLDFWASWVPSSQQELPWLEALRARLKDPAFTVLALNVDQRTEDARAFLADHPVQLPLAFDPSSQTAKLYGVQQMPSAFLIDRTGHVLWRHQGFRPADEASLEKAVRAALLPGARR